jgi:hypothetical protein
MIALQKHCLDVTGRHFLRYCGIGVGKVCACRDADGRHAE